MKDLKVGDAFEVEFQITDKMIRQFAEMSGDDNPIHLNQEFAQKTEFGRRIAHGMLSGALISSALTKSMGANGIYLSQSLKFQQPIFVDDKILIRLKVLSVKVELGIAQVETLVQRLNGDVCVKGEAIIKSHNYMKL